MKLPALYKKTSTGKDQVWEIWTVDNVIFEQYGQIGGKMQTTPGTECEGKNIGRSNETSPEQQAELEAQAKWEGKLKNRGYSQTLNDAREGKADAIVEGGILPMLAHKFSEQAEKLKYPCFVQPKLDGHRCIGMSTGLWSRTRKLITGVPYIFQAIRRFDVCLNQIALDGELYNHDYRNKFEQLTSFIKRDVPKIGHEVVQYHIYDVVMEGHSFRDRLAWLRETLGLKGNKNPALVLVETREVNNEDELMLAFEDFLEQGYEGAIARNADGLYVNKRSYDLLKIKQFDDAEFKCVAVEEGRGKMAGHGIFVCESGYGATFNAKMKGSLADLKKFFEHPELVVGRKITVQYQGKTKYGIPRFPVALRVHEKI